MKKTIPILFSLTLILGLGTNTFAAKNEVSDQERAIELIETTNLEINEIIKQGQDEADMLQAEYLEELQKIKEENGMIVVEESQNSLNSTQTNEVNIEEIESLLVSLEKDLVTAQVNTEKDHLLAVEDEINGITSMFESTESSFVLLGHKESTVATEIQELTNQYAKDLDKIISKVYKETLTLSQKTIKKAEKLGVIAECSWVLVPFADRMEWIDPIRIVGDF